MNSTTSHFSHEQTARKTEQIKTLALEMGFDRCGIAPAFPSVYKDYFEKWLTEGCAGEMHWMAKNAEKRIDPQKVLPGAATVVVVAVNYFRSRIPAPYQIARYAQGKDYHDWMEPRLEQLASVIRQICSCETRHYVDTGPVLEREIAARAGIGWQGKSTMLISPQLGTWFFIGEIITTAALAIDTPLSNHCGKCMRCIQACPTGAITAPYQLDARRCIAYLTIENKGPIPVEFRKAIGNRIFGCDDCLEVCPWNRFAHESQEPHFSPITLESLRTLLNLTEETFRAQYRGTPLFRIKRRGLIRNVCVALGNIGTSQDLPALQQTATDPDPLIQEHALWAIAEIQRKEPFQVTSSTLFREKNFSET